MLYLQILVSPPFLVFFFLFFENILFLSQYMTGFELFLPHKRSILAFFMLTILITYFFFLIIRIRYTCFGHVACRGQEAFFKSVYCSGSGAPWWLGDTLHILHTENYCCRKVEKSHTVKNHKLVVEGLSFGITFSGSTPHFSGG